MVQGSGQMGELLGRRRRRHLEIQVWNSFSFRVWIGLIWEISMWKADQIWVFCLNVKKSEFNDICNIEFFS